MSLENCINPIVPRYEEVGGVTWRNSGFCSYPTKCIVEKAYKSSIPLLAKPVIELVWKNYIPPRVQLTLWLAILEKLKTGDKLVALGIVDAQDALCPFCRLVVESNSHVLFTCSFSWGAWMEIMRWWGIQGVLHNCCEKFIVE